MLADRIRMATSGGGIDLSYVGAATSTSTSVTAPGGIASGDLAIYMDLATSFAEIPAAVTPSGFTNILNAGGALSGDDVRCMVSYKILTGGETSITGMNGIEQENKCLLVYRPDKSVTSVLPLSGASWGQQITASNPSSQATTLSGLSSPIVFLGISYGQTGGGFSTASPSFDATHTVGDTVFGRKLYNADPQNHTVDMNDTGFNALFSGYIRVT